MTTITITLPHATVEQALEALENAEDQLAKPYSTDASKAVVALRAALAQQAEPVEPVAGAVLNEEGRAALVEHGTEDWHCVHRNARRLYTAPPQQAEPVAWAFRHRDGTYHDPSVTEHSAGMVPLYPPRPSSCR